MGNSDHGTTYVYSIESRLIMSACSEIRHAIAGGESSLVIEFRESGACGGVACTGVPRS